MMLVGKSEPGANKRHPFCSQGRGGMLRHSSAGSRAGFMNPKEKQLIGTKVPPHRRLRSFQRRIIPTLLLIAPYKVPNLILLSLSLSLSSPLPPAAQVPDSDEQFVPDFHSENRKWRGAAVHLRGEGLDMFTGSIYPQRALQMWHRYGG